MIFGVKSPAVFAVAVMFMLATVCAAACPQTIQPTSCHSDEHQQTEQTLCLEKNFLTQKVFVDGFVLPVGTVTLAAPEVTPVASVQANPQIPSLANLRSVVLRI